MVFDQHMVSSKLMVELGKMQGHKELLEYEMFLFIPKVFMHNGHGYKNKKKLNDYKVLCLQLSLSLSHFYSYYMTTMYSTVYKKHNSTGSLE